MQVIFDDALSPGQLRNLEKAFSGENGRPGVKVREAADASALTGRRACSGYPYVAPCDGYLHPSTGLPHISQALMSFVCLQVCDRTALILDIFSQRAATREGKLQVGPVTSH
jgi:hypothetical protein